MESPNHWRNNEEILSANGALSVFLVEIADFKIIRFVFILRYTEKNSILLQSFEDNISLFFKSLPNSIKMFILKNFDYTLVDFIKIKNINSEIQRNNDIINIPNKHHHSIENYHSEIPKKKTKTMKKYPKNMGRFFLNRGNSIMAFDIKKKRRNLEILVQPQDLSYIVKNLLSNSKIQIYWNSMLPIEKINQIKGILKNYKVYGLTSNNLIRIKLKIK